MVLDAGNPDWDGTPCIAATGRGCCSLPEPSDKSQKGCSTGINISYGRNLCIYATTAHVPCWPIQATCKSYS